MEVRIAESVIGHQIEQVVYGEMNDPQGPFYYEGFHVVDLGINIQMSNGYWWHMYWKDDEIFELGEGLYQHNSFISPHEVLIWDATAAWQPYLPFEVASFRVQYIDDEETIPMRVSLTSRQGRVISLVIGEELNPNGTIPTPLSYYYGGELYILFKPQEMY